MRTKKEGFDPSFWEHVSSYYTLICLVCVSSWLLYEIATFLYISFKPYESWITEGQTGPAILVKTYEAKNQSCCLWDTLACCFVLLCREDCLQ